MGSKCRPGMSATGRFLLPPPPSQLSLSRTSRPLTQLQAEDNTIGPILPWMDQGRQLNLQMVSVETKTLAEQ